MFVELWHAESYIHLRTAFSRDQLQKIYVQDLICEDAAELYTLINEHHAHIYVCGDARHMARDVHRALVHVIAERGGHVMSEEEVECVLDDMERNGRYQKDVWIA